MLIDVETVLMKSDNKKTTQTNLTNPHMSSFDKILIASDFNFPDIKWGESNEDNFSEIVKDAFMVEHIEKPTRFRENQRNKILDLVLTKEIYDIDNIDYCTNW